MLSYGISWKLILVTAHDLLFGSKFMLFILRAHRL